MQALGVKLQAYNLPWREARIPFNAHGELAEVTAIHDQECVGAEVFGHVNSAIDMASALPDHCDMLGPDAKMCGGSRRRLSAAT